MLGHLGVNVPDLRAAKRYSPYLFFYPAVETTDHHPYSRHSVGLQHLAFMVSSRSAVDAIHLQVAADLAPRFGGQVVHEPRHFPQYAAPPQRAYYATFWLDPWGFMLEAVCHHDRA